MSKPALSGSFCTNLLLAPIVICASGCTHTEAPNEEPVALAKEALTIGNGKLEPGEQCDDGNTVSGDGCSASGVAETNYYCWVPGSKCSLKTACGNGTLDSGETCDNGTAGNSCSASCDFTKCGNGVRENGIYPDWSQEICDDANRYDGDGCNRLCEVESGWACNGSPSRCVPSGVVFYNTGVGNNFRVLAEGAADPHWKYSYNSTSAVVYYREASDWPRPLQGAQYLANATGSKGGNGRGCVYQEFQIPSTYIANRFTLVIAAFNDNQAEADTGQYFARVNSTTAVQGTGLLTLETPSGGQPWQKNVIYALTSSNPWVIGLNRVELCNDDEVDGPTGFRYFFADATDGRCGDGFVSVREQCDDGNTTAGDGCSSGCDIESGYGCVGTPSKCALTCGNGTLNPGEQCDDGNTASSDGCSSACRIESGYTCANPGALCAPICGDGKWVVGEECDDGNTTTADGCSPSCQVMAGWECGGNPGGLSTCSLLCGNRRIDAGELCDDGNRTAGDGCSAGCTVELGWACPTAGSACAKTCGNSLANPGEACDDGNTTSGDGCNAECSVEAGWVCPSAGACTKLTSCGNGALNTLEQCDDGNTVAADGCSASCQIEPGWQCAGSPSSCVSVCGDSRITGSETCDDGNTDGDDGCSDTCRTESGYACMPKSGMGPSSCAKTCGNAALNAGEQCDDGNVASGDGCTATCQYEQGWDCLGALGPCREICGNGIRTPSEECDDGNLVAADSCDLRCKLTGIGNGAPRITTLTYSIAEGTLGPVTIAATDPNSADVLIFSLLGGDDASLFTLEGSTGRLSFKTPPDFEDPADINRDNECAITVRVSDGKGGTDTQTIFVRVTDQANATTGGACSGSEDCTNRVCDGSTHLCLAPTCSDTLKNGLEADVDCGGGTCPACSSGKGCVNGADCTSGVCDGSTRLCLAPTCSDTVKNALETDVDCGGGTCPACLESLGCLVGTDCTSGVCDSSSHLCLAATCSDAVKNGLETDVDCGGATCSPCATSAGCLVATDCASGVCDASTLRCLAPTCNDTVKNGAETDIDCGGGTCAACGNSKGCASGVDCISGVCDGAMYLCLAPTCTDTVKNGLETDADCGGGTCLPCATSAGCLAPTDCASGVCDASSLRCLAPTCSDTLKNGLETDVDCGGGTCPVCATSKGCTSGADCISGVCEGATHLCLAPTCSDTLKNGLETDVDCGGGTCPVCATSKGCTSGADCISGVCDGATHLCLAPTCSDTLKNGAETDVDCGGGSCAACSNSKGCASAADCISGVCDSPDRICLAPTCGDGVKNGTETDVDCGGSTCSQCGDERSCLANSDCSSRVCDSTSQHCLIPTCSDGVKNATETDVDCGGSTCPGCGNTYACVVGADCKSKKCDEANHQCVAANCSDTLLNGSETDVDCGGADCSPCSDGKQCLVSSDCSSSVCDAGPKTCSASSCSDSVKNGGETDVDCGGTLCPQCVSGMLCKTGADCKSLVCEPSSQRCIGESCTDTIKNGSETDIDCGGSTCSPCATAKTCAANADCLSQVCLDNRCNLSGQGGGAGSAGQAGMSSVSGGQGGNGGSTGGTAGASPSTSAGSSGMVNSTGGAAQGGTQMTGGATFGGAATGGAATGANSGASGTSPSGGSLAPGGSSTLASSVATTASGADATLEGSGCNCTSTRSRRTPATPLVLLGTLAVLLRRRRAAGRVC